MKISLITGSGPGQVTTVLGDDDAKHFIENWLPSRVKETQTVAYLRGEWAGKFDRKNAQVVCPFRVTRLFSTYAASVVWVRDHVLELPTEGTLEVDAGGGRLLLENAQVDSFRVSQWVGVTVVCEYVITGGQWSAAAEA